MPVRNRDAEMAYEMAMKLLGANTTEEQRQSVWEECHRNKKLQDVVVRYRVATSDYAPKALVAIHRELMRVFVDKEERRSGNKVCASCWEHKLPEDFYSVDVDRKHEVCSDCMRKSAERFGNYVSGILGEQK
jgi:hypothetical protein